MTLYPSPSPSSSIPVTLDCRHIVVNVNRALPGKPRSSWYITSWNGPQPMTMLPPIEVEEEEVIRAKRLINSHAFRRLFPSPFVHPFRNLFATSIPLRDIAVCKYHVLHPFFFLLSTLFLSTLPSCLLVNHANGYLHVFGFLVQIGTGSRILRPERERESEKERDNYRVSRKNMEIRVDTRPRNDRDFSSSLSRPFLTRAFPTWRQTGKSLWRDSFVRLYWIMSASLRLWND